MNSSTPQFLSKCCNAPAVSAHDDDFSNKDVYEIVTCWFECSLCKMACDVIAVSNDKKFRLQMTSNGSDPCVLDFDTMITLEQAGHIISFLSPKEK